MASSGTLRILAIGWRSPAAFQYVMTSSARHYSGIACYMSNKLHPGYERRNLVANLNSPNSRGMTTSVRRTNKQTNDSAQKSESSTEPAAERTLFQRFKDDFARYWYVMLPVHITTSFGYFLCFYYLSKVGISPAVIMDFIGVPAHYIDQYPITSASHVAVGYAGYKLITPFRYITTIAVTRVTVRTLSSRGILKPMPTFSEFKQTIKAKIKSIRS